MSISVNFANGIALFVHPTFKWFGCDWVKDRNGYNVIGSVTLFTYEFGFEYVLYKKGRNHG
jgi:hypothetical protein